MLDYLQCRALLAFKNRNLRAILGGAGSEKSFLLKEILANARSTIGVFPAVAACALTNQSAFELGGTTVHSLFGAPAHWKISKEKLLEIVQKNSKRMDILRQVRLLVIDEVSLLTADMFNSIDHVFRSLAKTDIQSSVPFGGRQLVFSGDPFQLEAIGVGEVRYKSPDVVLPVFSSITWFLCFGGLGSGFLAMLSYNHRQSEDSKFFEVLQTMRHGIPTDEDIQLIKNTSQNSVAPPAEYTRLCLYKSQVQKVNDAFLSNIQGKTYKNFAKDSYISKRNSSLERRLRQAAPDLVLAKVGCEVILTKKSGNQIPGTKATVCAVVQNRESALHEIHLKVFSLSKSENFFKLQPQHISIRDTDTTVLAYRKQYPIIPAYVLTVHRSQGLTLSHVSMDFAEVKNWKPNGMVYVAISRCKTLGGLWVKGLTRSHIGVSPHAKALMQKIYRLHTHFPHRVMGLRPALPSILEQNNSDTIHLAVSKR